MDYALQKTISLLLLILIGVLLKLKFKNPDEITGLKKIILNLALPATIFMALLKIEISKELALLPIIAILLNFLLFALAGFLLPVVGISKNSPEGRTSRLLIPSLAPGLSCFPFVLEFLGDDYLAKAAMADLGNKIFVLIVLYIIAMKWFYKNNSEKIKQVDNSKKIKDLLLSMVKEPVNLFIISALVLVLFGVNLSMFPSFFKDVFSRLSVIMTPLILIFIGLAFKIKRRQFLQIFALLLLRAGIVLMLMAGLVLLFDIPQNENVLLLVAFALSACSFWPFAHISMVDAAEKNKEATSKTFSNSFAIGILALSLPISTLLILAILSSGEVFTSPFNLVTLGVLCCFGAVFSVLCKSIKIPKQVSSSKELFRKSTT
ncbi:permease [Galbibacter sp. BG1]|uniref:AEC family transporter n=1 Tax=Galbibacter sp. BG1 TaxID=1170699 RepID=UPI0015BB82AA|nr:permease [Galbibacter sp. BG1]QLE01344.1 permease [Galbibacter sp. BG1]